MYVNKHILGNFGTGAKARDTFVPLRASPFYLMNLYPLSAFFCYLPIFVFKYQPFGEHVSSPPEKNQPFSVGGFVLG